MSHSAAQSKFELLLQTALELHARGQLDEAEKLFVQALANKPNDFTALHQLGVIKNQQGDFEAATRWLTEALLIHPRSALGHLNLGISKGNLGQLEEALSHYQYSLAIHPDNPDALLNCAVTLHGLKRPHEALHHLNNLLAKDSRHFLARKYRWLLLEELGQSEVELLNGSVQTYLKLNLGCGFNKRPDCLNVDMFPECSPDILMNLEILPWIWGNDSISEIHFHHSLEHIGADSKLFLAIMCELYRVSCDDCQIIINVPHPRHDDFLGDPTHVRAITPQMFSLFSKRLNYEWKQKGVANTPLATYLNVNFEIEQTTNFLAEPYGRLLKDEQISKETLELMIKEKNNIVSEILIILRVIK